MFLRNSRYADLPTESVRDPHGPTGAGTPAATVAITVPLPVIPLTAAS